MNLFKCLHLSIIFSESKRSQHRSKFNFSFIYIAFIFKIYKKKYNMHILNSTSQLFSLVASHFHAINIYLYSVILQVLFAGNATKGAMWQEITRSRRRQAAPKL